MAIGWEALMRVEGDLHLRQQAVEMTSNRCWATRFPLGS
jgi:hypothetical protein